MNIVTYNPAASSASASSMIVSGREDLGLGSMIQDMNNRYQMEFAKQQQQAAQNSADRAMQFEDQQALRARQWQLEDRETAYQVAMKDMRKAGLNPALAYKQGGASVGAPIAGSGSMASMSQSGYDAQSLVDVLRESMSNQSALEVSALNGMFGMINSLIGSSARVLSSLIGIFDIL